MKGVDLAGIFTGTGDFNDSAIRAGPFAVAAFNTYIIINMGTALIYGNGLFRAAIHAAMGQTPAADIRNHVLIHRAGRAAFRQDGNDMLRAVNRFRNGLLAASMIFRSVSRPKATLMRSFKTARSL